MTASAPLTRRGTDLQSASPSRLRFDETPGSISAAQKTKLILAAKNAGQGVDDIRGMCPEGSIRRLSRAQAAAMIEKFVGHGLPAEGTKGRRDGGTRWKLPARAPAGVIRMITNAHVAQIDQLLDDIFRTEAAGTAWLKQTWGVSNIWELGTARNAGKLIAQLKRKLDARKPLWHG